LQYPTPDFIAVTMLTRAYRLIKRIGCLMDIDGMIRSPRSEGSAEGAFAF
jgi:hypothetical protein